MKLEIERTQTVVHIKGVKCHLWNGRTETGAKCHVVVAVVLVPPDQINEEFAELTELSREAKIN